jgi:hypothetical protein
LLIEVQTVNAEIAASADRDGDRVISLRFVLQQLSEVQAEAERQILARGGA